MPAGHINPGKKPALKAGPEALTGDFVTAGTGNALDNLVARQFPVLL